MTTAAEGGTVATQTPAAGGAVQGEPGAELGWAGTPELTALAQTKGWKVPADALTGYKHLESLLGARAGDPDRLVVVPGPESSPEEWAKFYTRSGRPEKVEGYKLEGTPEGPLRDKFAEWAFESGLSQSQAQSVAKQFVAFSEAAEKEQEEAFCRSAEVALREVEKEWGSAFQENILAGRQFAQRFQLGQEDLDALEQAWGTKAMLTRLAAWGRAYREHVPAVGTEGGGPMGATPAYAQQEIQRLLADPEFGVKLTAGNAEARKKWDELHKLAYPA